MLTIFKTSTNMSQETSKENNSFRFDDKDIHSLEKNHTHFLLFDDGKYFNNQGERNTASIQQEFSTLINYPKELQRSDFVTHACRAQDC